MVVNGKYILFYGYRIGLEKIDILGIYGKVNIYLIGFSFSLDL